MEETVKTEPRAVAVGIPKGGFGKTTRQPADCTPTSDGSSRYAF